MLLYLLVLILIGDNNVIFCLMQSTLILYCSYTSVHSHHVMNPSYNGDTAACDMIQNWQGESTVPVLEETRAAVQWEVMAND